MAPVSRIPKVSPNDTTNRVYRSASYSWTSLDDVVSFPHSRSTRKGRWEDLYKYDITVVRGRRHAPFEVNEAWSKIKECAITLRGLVISSEEMSKNGRNVTALPDPDQPGGDPPPETCYLRLCVARKLDDGHDFVEQRWLMIYPLEERDLKIQDKFRRLGIVVVHGDFLLDRTTQYRMLQLV